MQHTLHLIIEMIIKQSGKKLKRLDSRAYISRVPSNSQFTRLMRPARSGNFITGESGNNYSNENSIFNY